MPFKLHIWMNFPSHHQDGFFESLIDQGVDLKVTYYAQVSADRIALGWLDKKKLADWEFPLENSNVSFLERLMDLADYIHIIPGYGTPMLRQLAIAASKRSIAWCHWSESSSPGFRWLVGYPRKSWYAAMVNQHSIGAFAQGTMARVDFMNWGIKADKIANLTYSVRPLLKSEETDQRIVNFAANRSVFLFLGQLIHRKGIDIQLKAFASLNLSDWCMAIVGNGESDRYVQQASALGLEKKVLFLPAVDAQHVSSVYQASDVLLLPSRFDGWGAVANEAASHSKALILSAACGAAWHLIEPGVNGFIVNPGSVTSLSNAMNYYAEGGKNLALSHGRESARISQHYTCDASARRMIQALSSWLGRSFR